MYVASCFSHTMTFPSSDADASLLPSGENCTAATRAEWPSSVSSRAVHCPSICGEGFTQSTNFVSRNCRVTLLDGVNSAAAI